MDPLIPFTKKVFLVLVVHLVHKLYIPVKTSVAVAGGGKPLIKNVVYTNARQSLNW
jgi:hypothetical protein